ncbi:Kinetochore protein [Lachnellula subtilissima]|uniref:Kinetochore protein n=1 Tax=Lachnellula subtilissima TaxID=602034 RepID=A0A8H8U4J5_9HELO|nr:Kinetochore protein [Lachnellula subtilissima]
MGQSSEEILDSVLELQNGHELSIIKLSEPVAGPLKKSSGERTSDVSADVFENPTPASLEADLAHYKPKTNLWSKELFSKLRFSYLEQVTKEKFIRAIVGDPPLVVEHQENVELESSLAVSKTSLKAQKTEVAELVAELEKRGRELCRKYENVQLQTRQLQELPDNIEGLQASIEELKATQQLGSNPILSMPLEKTLALVEERQRERAELDRQLEQLQLLVPRKTRELERLNAELQPLEVKRLGSTASAREAKRRKEEALGGFGDDLEERGRWWRGVEGGLKGMLGVEG